MLEIIILVVLVAIFGTLIFILVKMNANKSSDVDVEKSLETKLNEMFPKVMREANEQLVLMASQKLESEKKQISVDLQSKKSAIEDLVKRISDEIKENNAKLVQSDRTTFASFTSLKQELENYKEITEQLKTTTEGLRSVLSNNQMRGQFGEQVAENLLQMSGFVRGTDYEFNKEQKGSETRPDFSIFLPDGTRINVDAKFPYSNLQKYVEAEDTQSKAELLKAFQRDIKAKVTQVTTRDYINPEDKTVDFVILFIPNEMIFSFIYDKMNETWTEAMKNKVVFAGPFSFTAILRMVKQAYDNFKYQKNAQKIISYIKAFEKEFEKYNTEFEKIGKKLNEASTVYNSVNTTRTNQLMRTVEKIRLEESKTDDMIDDQQELLPPIS